jgi:hypothetical protein
MNKAGIKAKIAEYELIKSKSTEISEIQFCDAKIARLQSQLSQPIKKAKPKKPEYVDNIDYDFEKPNNKKLVEAKKRHLKKSILDEFADIF